MSDSKIHNVSWFCSDDAVIKKNKVFVMTLPKKLKQDTLTVQLQVQCIEKPDHVTVYISLMVKEGVCVGMCSSVDWTEHHHILCVCVHVHMCVGVHACMRVTCFDWTALYITKCTKASERFGLQCIFMYILQSQLTFFLRSIQTTFCSLILNTDMESLQNFARTASFPLSWQFYMCMCWA